MISQAEFVIPTDREEMLAVLVSNVAGVFTSITADLENRTLTLFNDGVKFGHIQNVPEDAIRRLQERGMRLVDIAHERTWAVPINKKSFAAA